MLSLTEIQRLIIDVPDFPKPGVVFKDITPILENAEAFKSLSLHFAERVSPQANKIVAIESRGFILGAAISQHLNVGLVIARKPGKLPRQTIRETYQLEYGEDSLEIHKDALRPGDKIVIVDDVLATGGTARAAEALCEKSGAVVLGSVFLMELGFLKGRDKLKNQMQSLILV